MTAGLQPMSLGEVLDRSFQMYRSRFRMYLGIGSLAALGTLAIVVLRLVLNELLFQTTLAPSTRDFLANGAASISFFTWQSLCGFFAWPIFAFAASQQFVGNRVTLRSAMEHCVRRWRAWLVLLSSLWAIWIGIPAIIESVPIFARARMNAALTLSQGAGTIAEWPRSLFYIWLGWIASFALSTALWVGIPAWTIENLGFREVSGRIRALSKGVYWRIAITWCITGLLGWLLDVSISLVLGLAVRVLYAMTGRDIHTLPRAFYLTPGFTVFILVVPLFPIALTLFYYDQRIRHEGFDIEIMMNAAGMNAPEIAATAALPAAADVPVETAAPLAGAELEERPK